MSNSKSSTPKRCFIVMGFGIKTDFATGRQLDLNKSYKILVKPVVESRGLICIRADEIQHSGSIDLHMYQQLLSADIVIADLSTSNVNAFYELGIRHALRPRTTIVISEDKLGYPFDLNHIKITSYTHLGSAIDYEEVERFRRVLGETIDTVLNLNDPDSPVYTHLHELAPPVLRKKASKAIRQLQEVAAAEIENGQEYEEHAPHHTLAVLAEQGEEALTRKDFVSAKALFHAAIQANNGLQAETIHKNAYFIQRLALATYKTQYPDRVSALKEAIALLNLLNLEESNDPETVTLAGKIEKRLYEAEKSMHHLSRAISFYERGYHLLQNRYHGTNLAFLLNKRVDTPIFETREDKIADMVVASRIRRQVLKMCDEDQNAIDERKRHTTGRNKLEQDFNLKAIHEASENEQRFWIQVNKAEAHFGLGEFEQYEKAVERARQIDHTAWMMKAFEDELKELRILMKKHGHLLNPPWNEEVGSEEPRSQEPGTK